VITIWFLKPKVFLFWGMVITCFIIWLSIPVIGLIWLKSTRLNIKVKIILGIGILVAFAVFSMLLGNYIDYQINASLQRTGK